MGRERRWMSKLRGRSAAPRPGPTPVSAAPTSVGLSGLVGSVERVVVVDCETTGVFTRDRVVEVGLVTLDVHGRVIDRWETLVNPGRDAGPSWLHGVTGELLAHAPSFEAVAGALAARLDGAVLAAHNLPFDARMLAGEFDRLGIDFDPGQGLDTLRATGGRLTEVCRQQGIDLSQAHRALHDAEATAQLLLRVTGQLSTSTRPAAIPRRPPSLERTVRRDELAGAVVVHVSDPPFLARTAAGLQHRDEGDPAVVGYLELLDRALANLHIDAEQATELSAFAAEVGLDEPRRRTAHQRYLDELIDEVLTDHAITDEEYDQLVRIAAALDIDQELVHRRTRSARLAEDEVHLLPGMSVCFTGEVDGVPRDQLTDHARQLGLEVEKNVTKSTDLLLAADPASGSGKAEKARRYAIPIARADRILHTATGQPIPATVAQVERRIAFTCQRCRQTWTLPARSAHRRKLCESCRSDTPPRTAEPTQPTAPTATPSGPSRPMAPAPAPPPAAARTETLTCESCATTWQREIKRGRKPRRCPACT